MTCHDIYNHYEISLSIPTHTWLVVWNMFNFSIHLGISMIPTDTLHHFSEGLVETSNQKMIDISIIINPGDDVHRSR